MVSAVTYYNVLKTIHVLAVVIWVGGAVTLNLLGTRLIRTQDGPRMLAFAGDAEWVGQRVYMPASIVVLVAGVLAVIEGPWSFGDPWVSIGFVGVIVTALTGSLFFGPELGRISQIGQSRGVDDPDMQQRITRLVPLLRIDLVILLLIIVDMVIKPGD
jgi:uncharacterized membrane protein